MSAARRLGALDAGFLDAETDRTPMHVAAVCLLEGGHLLDDEGHVRLAEVARHVEARLHLLPRLRQVVRTVPFGLGRPVWVDDRDFDVAHHLRVVRLPDGSGRDDLLALASRLSMELLDRSRPLWEFVFVEGLAGGRVGLVEKIHHAMVDGVAGVDLTATLVDLEPDATVEPGPAWSPRPAPGPVELAAGVARDVAGIPLRLARTGVTSLASPRRTWRGVASFADGLGTLLGRDATAPGSSLNRTIGRDRQLVVVPLDLAQVKAVAHAHGTKVNDVVLALVSGGLRAVLETRGEPIGDRPFHALVPRNVRTGDEAHDLGNRVSAFVAPLPLHEPDPVRRVAYVREEMARLRDHHESEAVLALGSLADDAPYALTAALARQIHRQPLVNVVVTNVPGPPMPLYVLGARMTEIIPVVPLGGNLTLGVALLSYLDTLTIGLHADAEACGDVDVVAGAIHKGLEELSATAAS